MVYIKPNVALLIAASFIALTLSLSLEPSTPGVTHTLTRRAVNGLILAPLTLARPAIASEDTTSPLRARLQASPSELKLATYRLASPDLFFPLTFAGKWAVYL